MKFQVYLVAAFVGVMMHSASSKTINAPAAQEHDDEKERIIGGKSAEEGQFPWATVLFYNNRFICTSSIISPRTILTAAHCVVFNGVTEPAENFRVLANYRMSADSVNFFFYYMSTNEIYTDSQGIQNDIAVLTTKEPIPFSDTVKPICIARSDTKAMQYRNATAMGWGNTSRNRFSPEIPDELQYVEQKIVSNLVCSLGYFGLRIEDSKICAGFFNGICNGDSGGPLVHLSADKPPVEIGVASFINGLFGCGSVSSGVWTRVSSYNDFIMGTAVDRSAICEV